MNRRLFLRNITASAISLGSGSAEDRLGRDATDILAQSMQRAAKCCLAWLNPDQYYFPTGGWEVAHDTGRWWDAMLRWEAATQSMIPSLQEMAMLRNIEDLAANPGALLTNTARTGAPPQRIVTTPHNLRESMLAYNALVRFRKSEWARAQGHRLLKTIQDSLTEGGQLDQQCLAKHVGVPLRDGRAPELVAPGKWFNTTGTTGRALEAIVWFGESTGDELAAEVAGRIAKTHLRQMISPDGHVRKEILDSQHIGHNHSYLGMLRGLLLYGLWTGRKEYIHAVSNTYRRGLFGTNISESGWAPHDLGKLRFPDAFGDPKGDHASCGDVAQLALWLALRAGEEDLLDDVELLIRARLLPSQIADQGNPRQYGAWGIYSHPFGRSAILDVIAAVLHSLVDFYQHIVTTRPDGTASVNLHFTTETPSASVRVSRSDRGRLVVVSKKRQPLRVRVPGWAPRSTLRFTRQGRQLPLRWQGTYLIAGTLDANKAIELEYELPERKSVEIMRLSGRKFELSWRGDAVVSCSPEVPIYPAGNRA